MLGDHPDDYRQKAPAWKVGNRVRVTLPDHLLPETGIGVRTGTIVEEYPEARGLYGIPRPMTTRVKFDDGADKRLFSSDLEPTGESDVTNVQRPISAPQSAMVR